MRTMTMTIKTTLLSKIYPRDNQPGWKVTEEGTAEMKDGNPVYVDASGREMVVKHDTISNLNAESKSLREAKEKAENALKEFEGLDGKLAREAIEKLKKIDAKELIDAGKVDEVKEQIKAEYEKQLSEKDGLAQQLQQRLDNMQVDSIFSQSDFVRNNIAVPQDMFEASFRNYFKVEDGKVVAYDKSGNRLMSKQNVGEFASPDEALKLLVESHPQKDTILKADTGNGSGADGSGGYRGATGKLIKRADFDALPPMKQAEAMKKVTAGEAKLVD